MLSWFEAFGAFVCTDFFFGASVCTAMCKAMWMMMLLLVARGADTETSSSSDGEIREAAAADTVPVPGIVPAIVPVPLPVLEISPFDAGEAGAAALSAIPLALVSPFDAVGFAGAAAPPAAGPPPVAMWPPAGPPPLGPPPMAIHAAANPLPNLTIAAAELRFCSSCHQHSYLRKDGCINRNCKYFYMFSPSFRPRGRGDGNLDCCLNINPHRYTSNPKPLCPKHQTQTRHSKPSTLKHQTRNNKQQQTKINLDSNNKNKHK